VSEIRTVNLPAALCAAAEEKMGDSFGSLEELLVFVLRELTSGTAIQADEAEEKLVEERLRQLGYL
jgi:hypothetical protein